ncbi:MAG: sugar transferase [Janthinobacterium lividum]
MSSATSSHGSAMLKRGFDFTLAAMAMLVLSPVLLCVALVVKWTSAGPVLYWSERVGRNNRIFVMPKFRTMLVDTPAVATHLLVDPNRFLTRVGPFLRRTSLDELPQFWSIIKGDMSFVGPRPALFNQYDLVALRTEAGVDKLLPGLTGWAQINGRDELPIPQKVQLDVQYMNTQSFWMDLKIMFLTALKVIRSEGVSH